MAILNPSAMSIVLGGTLGAVIVGMSFELHQGDPGRHEGVQRRRRTSTPRSSSRRLRRVRRRARCGARRGHEPDRAPHTRRASSSSTSTDPDLVADILESENDAMQRQRRGREPFYKAGYAPTMGIIGTVFGLINAPGPTTSPRRSARSISAAFIARCCVAMADVHLPPDSARCNKLVKDQLQQRALLIVEGNLRIQACYNPRVVQEKLLPSPSSAPPRATAAAVRARPRRRPRNRSWPVTSSGIATKRSTRTR